MEAALLAKGNGTRAVVFGVNNAGEVGHVWNAVVQAGRINYIDGQIGAGGAGNFSMFPNIQYGLIN